MHVCVCQASLRLSLQGRYIVSTHSSQIAAVWHFQNQRDRQSAEWLISSASVNWIMAPDTHPPLLLLFLQRRCRRSLGFGGGPCVGGGGGVGWDWNVSTTSLDSS